MATRGQGAHPAIVADRTLVDDQLDFIHALISRKVAIEHTRGSVDTGGDGFTFRSG